jgi:Ca2+-binding EF-hand superfamily protein
MKNLIRKAFNKILKDNPSKLSTKALDRASKIEKPRAGTPHDWEDYEKYLKEFEKNQDGVNLVED